MFKNKRNKRGAELSLNVIIVAAIALIVLVILVLIFTGRIAIFRFGVEDCYAKGGKCATTCGENEARLTGTNCKATGSTDTRYTGDYCCIPA